MATSRETIHHQPVGNTRVNACLLAFVIFLVSSGNLETLLLFKAFSRHLVTRSDSKVALSSTSSWLSFCLHVEARDQMCFKKRKVNQNILQIIAVKNVQVNLLSITCHYSIPKVLNEGKLPSEQSASKVPFLPELPRHSWFLRTAH